MPVPVGIRQLRLRRRQSRATANASAVRCTSVNLAALIVSFAALGVAMIAAVHAKRSADAAEATAVSSREYADLETARRQDEIEAHASARAALERAEVTVRSRSTDGIPAALTVRNVGPAKARSVRFEPTDAEAVFWAPDQQSIIGATFDLERGESRTSPFTAYAHRPQVIQGVLSWTDGVGDHMETRTIDLLAGDDGPGGGSASDHQLSTAANRAPSRDQRSHLSARFRGRPTPAIGNAFDVYRSVARPPTQARERGGGSAWERSRPCGITGR